MGSSGAVGKAVEASRESSEPQESDKRAFQSFKLPKNKKAKAAIGASQDKEGGQDGTNDKTDGQRELIVAVEGEGVVAADGTVLNSHGTGNSIPRLENTWQPEEKAKKASALQEILHDVENVDRFESASEQQEDKSVSYGLSVRQKPQGQLEQPHVNAFSLRDREEQKLREDLGKLPDEADLTTYESMPIDIFGEALLRGMGWKKGEGIGRNKKGEAEAVEYVPRPNRLGLGATPKQIEQQEKKYIKPGESREGKKDLVAAAGPDGRVRHVRKVGEQLVERDRGEVKEGKRVMVVGGRHKGLEARVVRGPVEVRPGEKKFVVRLLKSEEEVSVWEEEVVDKRLWEEEHGRAQARKRALEQVAGGDNIEGANSSRQSRVWRGSREEAAGISPGHLKNQGEERRREGEGRESAPDDKERDKGAGNARTQERRLALPARGRLSTLDEPSGHGQEERSGSMNLKKPSAVLVRHPGSNDTKSSPWLMNHIRVRIISKSRAGGKLYLSKGTVLDVVTPRQCDVLLDGDKRKIVDGMHADELETVLPKRDGRVVLLRGPHRGERGKLLEKISRNEEAVVQLAQSFEIVRVSLDDVAEFVGEEHAYEA